MIGEVLSFLLLLVTGHSIGQDTGPHFMTAPHSSCQVWYDNNFDADSISWKGACWDQHAEGPGSVIWFKNKEKVASYQGNMHNGKFEGKGVHTVNGYGILSGLFKDGLLQGQGLIALNSWGRLQGNFVNGELLNLSNRCLLKLRTIVTGIKDSTGIYQYNEASDHLFYYILTQTGTPKAVLILLPSTGETTESVVSSNKALMEKCFDNNILPVVLSMNYIKTLESDPAAFAFLNQTFKEISTKFKAPPEKFILCGLSLGGENALQYTEMSRNPAFQTTIKPMAVIGVDPPVDEADLYNNAKEAVEFYRQDSSRITASIKEALIEDNFLTDYFQKLYGGSPEQMLQRYIGASVFSRNQPDGGNAKYLLDVPVRLYADPDIFVT